MIKGTIYKSVDSHVGRFVARAFPTLHPNVFTFLGVGTGLVAAYFLYLGRFRTGLLFLLLSGFLDIMDGIVARATGKTSRFGSFLDSATDRFSDYVILIGLILHFSETNRLPELYLTLALLPAYALIPYIRAKVESYGIPCEIGFAERGERIGILGFGLLTGWMIPFLILLNAAVYYTVGQRLVFAYRNIRD